MLYKLILNIKSNCYCGNSYGSYGIATTDLSCSNRCPGWQSYMCGGNTLLNSIYATSLGY